MTRREFITLTAAATGSLIARPGLAQPAPIPRPQPKIPRWRGFNLTEMNGGPAEAAPIGNPTSSGWPSGASISRGFP